MALSKSLAFLKEIKIHNNREWMQDNKAMYEEAKQEFLQFAVEVISGLSQVDQDLIGLDPKKCVFRINRDIRFSKDKSPYKTNFGMYLSEGGKNSGKAGYYFHLEPDQSMIAGGIYKPDSQALTKIRQEVDYNGGELKRIIEEPAFYELFGPLQGETLKKAPKGYQEDHPNIEVLKLKSYLAIHGVSDEEVLQWSSVERCVSTFTHITPLVNFINVAIS